MSEIDNSTLVESALEMQPQEQEPAVATEATAEASTPSVSNQEAMTALLLSRVKKQSKQLESLTRLLGQVPAQFRNVERKQSRQSRLVSKQLRVLQNQIRQVQKQVARIKVGSTGPRKRKAKRKATKSKARRR
ncbi:MAG: hypothetical protein ACREA4_06940 [Nitrososphaera sp.]